MSLAFALVLWHASPLISAPVIEDVGRGLVSEDLITTVTDPAGNAYLTWPTELGYSYKIIRSTDLQRLGSPDAALIDLDALAFQDTEIYGCGQIARVKIADAPPPPVTSGIPQPLVPAYMFWGVGMPDGNAMISWIGADGGNYTEFLQGFDLRETVGIGTGPLLSGVASIGIGSPDPEYSMLLFGPGESARWGDCAERPEEPGDYRYDDPAISGSAGGDWLSSVAYRVETWIPERREHFVRALYAEDLADPVNHPDIPLNN
ncbi:MAG: hypothetical protein ACR2RV_11455 [Verrucomicrobiales bacterium]